VACPWRSWARQAEPSLQNPELASPGFSLAEWMDAIARLAERHPDPRQLRRAIGAMALATSTVVEEARRAVIQTRLSHHDWPPWDLRIVAVDASTGDPVVFDRAAGVGLVDAVTASCAVPGVWPPATVNGIRYVDGGIRTMTNADLAAGHRRVLVLAPLDEPAVHQQLAGLARASSSSPTRSPSPRSEPIRWTRRHGPPPPRPGARRAPPKRPGSGGTSIRISIKGHELTAHAQAEGLRAPVRIAVGDQVRELGAGARCVFTLPQPPDPTTQ
jgi:NTE family protein